MILNIKRAVSRVECDSRLNTSGYFEPGLFIHKKGGNKNGKYRKIIRGQGVKKRASMILNYFKSLRGIAPSLKSVKRLVGKIKNYKASQTKTPPDPENKEAVKKHNQGEQSYGDLTQAIKDLNEILKTIPQYQPNNILIQTATLDTFIITLDELNESVNKLSYELSALIRERSQMYEDLKDKMKRIKSYVLGDYGRNSAEYQFVSGIRV